MFDHETGIGTTLDHWWAHQYKQSCDFSNVELLPRRFLLGLRA
jgi:hypothetical protein